MMHKYYHSNFSTNKQNQDVQTCEGWWFAVFLFLHTTANLPHQGDDKIIEAHFKMWLYVDCAFHLQFVI